MDFSVNQNQQRIDKIEGPVHSPLIDQRNVNLEQPTNFYFVSVWKVVTNSNVLQGFQVHQMVDYIIYINPILGRQLPCISG